jgi:hypothetical protein
MSQPLPTDAAERKTYPIYGGFITYFPHAIAAVSHLSHLGQQQHHPDKPLHWDMDKSTDELDALMRHIIDEDWVHVAWITEDVIKDLMSQIANRSRET